MSRKFFAIPMVLISLFSLALLAAACGDDDDNGGATPTTSTQASPTAQAKAAYPVQVTDLLGRSVEIKARPQSVVALSPTAAEFVYAAGGTIVGRVGSVKFPEAAAQAKEVGTAYQPSFEAILALKPDLVVADSIIHAQQQLRKPIEDLGVPVIFAGADSYQKVIDGLTLMGKVFDAADKTKQVAAGVDKALADAKATLAGKQVTAVALIADRDQTLYAAKPGSYAGDILAKLGITNPAATQPDAGPFPGYTAVPPEKLVQYNPDFIFTITPAPEPAPRLNTLIPQIPPFKGLKAVTTPNHVLEAGATLFLEAPGPRIVDAIKLIAKSVSGP